MFQSSHRRLVRLISSLIVATTYVPKPAGAMRAPAESPPLKTAVGPVDPEAKAVALQEGASYITQFKFKPRSYDLTGEGLKHLREIVAKATREGRIDTIHVIVWADKEYPSSRRRQLAPDEIRLADRRAKAVADYFREHDVHANIEAYNMGERPNTLLSMLPTADTRIKKSLEGEGIPTTAQDLSTPKYASKVVILVLMAK